MTFPFPFLMSSSNVKPRYSFRNSYGNSTNSSSYTFTGCDIGDPSVNRFVVVSCHHEGLGGFAGCTIGGESAALLGVANTSGQMGVAMYGLLVPSGATASISFSISGFTTFGIIGVWAVYDLRSITPFDTDEIVLNSATLSGSVSIDADGIVIAAMTGGESASTDVTWTNATRDFRVGPPSGEDCATSGASYQAGAAEASRIITSQAAKGSGTNAGMVLVSLR